jgi:hypothetical protein
MSNLRMSTVRQIAAEYDALPSLSGQSTETREIWHALAFWNSRQAARLTADLEVIYCDYHPYETAAEQYADILAGRFKVSTSDCVHPVWSVSANVNYRIVHDILGHTPLPGQSVPEFTLVGELVAWQRQRAAMVTADADHRIIAAAFTETVGQLCSAVVSGNGFGVQKVGILPSFNAADIVNDRPMVTV